MFIVCIKDVKQIELELSNNWTMNITARKVVFQLEETNQNIFWIIRTSKTHNQQRNM